MLRKGKLETYLVVVLLLNALFFLYIGVKVSYSNHPIFISAKTFFFFLSMIIGSILIYQIDKQLQSETPVELSIFITPIMSFIVLSYFWFQMKGYIAVGVSDRTLRDAINYSLEVNQLNYEDLITGIHLKDLNAKLDISIQDWVATGQVKVHSIKNKGLLDALMSGVNDFYRTKAIEANNDASYSYLFFSAILIVFSFLIAR